MTGPDHHGAVPGAAIAVAVVALGGAVGAVLRWAAGELVPDGDGLAWTTSAVDVVGSGLLALLPALAAARRHRLVALGLGPGLLGGFTTLSLHAEQGRALLAAGSTGTAAVHLLGTLAACLLAVVLARLVVAAVLARDAATSDRP